MPRSECKTHDGLIFVPDCFVLFVFFVVTLDFFSVTQICPSLIERGLASAAGGDFNQLLVILPGGH